MEPTQNRTDAEAPDDRAGPAETVVPADAAPRPAPRPRPLIERIGMALVAAVMAVMFGTVGAAAFVSGEPFLGTMAAIGSLMTLWVGAMSLRKG